MRNPPHLLAKFSTMTPERRGRSVSPPQPQPDLTFNIDLEVEQVNSLPVGAVQGEDVPGLADLGRAAQRHHVQVGEDPQ